MDLKKAFDRVIEIMRDMNDHQEKSSLALLDKIEELSNRVDKLEHEVRKIKKHN